MAPSRRSGPLETLVERPRPHLLTTVAEASAWLTLWQSRHYVEARDAADPYGPTVGTVPRAGRDGVGKVLVRRLRKVGEALRRAERCAER